MSTRKKISRLVSFVTVSLCLSSCLDKDKGKENSAKEMEQELKETKARQKALEAELAEKKAQKEAEQKAESEAKALEAKIALEKEMAEKEAKQAIEDEKERVRQEEISKRQKKQEMAQAKFKKTKYDELTLLDGKVLKSVVVTAVNPSKVSLMHQNGVKNVRYSNLPKEIGEVCLYDEELELIYLEEQEIIKQAKLERDQKVAMMIKEKKEAQKAEREAAKKQSSKKRPSYSAAKEKVEVVNPRGDIRVKVVASRKGRKTVSVVAKSNVDAYLTLNDWVYHRYYKERVTANVLYNHTWRDVGNKYEIKLISKKDGRILGQEAWNRKSGLR